MFNFMKKGNIEKDEKEKRKKEKEGKKKRERTGMTAEELLRIDEMRRSLKIRSRRKEKEKLPSGITADYSENFFADLDRDPEFRSGSLPGHTKAKDICLGRGDGTAHSDSSEASLNSLHNQAPQKVLPPLPPRPPKRGILKGSKTSVNSSDYYENQDPNSTSLLVRNTLQNEVITYQNVPQKTNGVATHKHSSPEHKSGNYLSVNGKNNLLSVISTSPSAESLTDTTNSSFATPPFSLSPTGESPGFGRTHSSVDDKNLELPLPSIVPFQLPKPRELTIHRSPKGDFGFQLRRAIITDKLSSVCKKTVTFAEPGAITGNRNETGLLPGDILLEVNGIQVQDKSREEIIDLIKSSGSSVVVKVQPIPELCELTRRSGLDGHYVVLDDSNIRGGTLKRSGSLRFKKMTAKTEEELTIERALLESEKLWLVHKGGFTAVRALPNSQNHQNEGGRVKVKVEKTNEVLEVDDDDLEKANPSQLDKVEDICQLRYINESSVLYILRQRFGNNLIHTYAAGNLIVINPQCTLSIYNEKVAALFRGCKSEDMPPHIYAMAQTTYRSMLSTRKDQSIVLMGRSGSGKTHNFRHILSYLLHSAGSVNKVLTVEKLNALNTVLEAFGNARTCLNVNATRCTNLISLDFDQTGQIASISLQMLMLEKQRVGKRPDGEGTFNVFYWLLAGAEGALAKQLLLDSTTHNNNLFITALYKNEDRQRAVMELTKLNLALRALGITEKEIFVIWSILAVIFHLGNAGTVRVGTNKWQFADPVHSSRACRLLGTTTEELCQALWNSSTSPSRTPSPGEKDKSVTGAEALEGFVVGLYSELVNVVINLINRCLTTNVHSSVSLVVVDSPGVQNPSSCGQQRGATFGDLCHNYVQERLHLLFHNVNLVAPHDRYTQEHIDVNTEEIYTESNGPNQLVSILDKSPPSGVLKTSQTDLREIDRRGLLFLLDEESLYPNSSDDTFLDRLFTHYGGKDHQAFIRKSSGAGHFVIQHFQGTNPVTYSAHGLLKASKENPLTRVAATFLQESTKEDISELFIKGKGGLLAAGAEGSQSLRRVSSIRRTCSVAVKRKSISLQVKFTTDSLIETLRRTRPRFVFCMLPHHNAGNTEIIPGPATGENSLNVPLLRSQIRGAEILPAVRMFKQGFPEYYPHGEFRRRFRLLAPGSGSVSEQTTPSGVQITINGQSPEALDEARAVEEMLLQMDVDITSYRIGLTQIFFRAGILAQLESQRDEKLADLVIQLQSRCRGYIARKKLAKLKVQDLAVRCIQRNVRKLMQVREWPWWRLYVKVTPLLNVHRTEEELTAKIQELEALKATLEKVELERNQLKLENDKLETKEKKMERNLSFFDAWRAKNKERKYSELSSSGSSYTGRSWGRQESGVLSRFMRMGNQDVSLGSATESSIRVKSILDNYSSSDKENERKISCKMTNGDKSGCSSGVESIEVKSIAENEKIIGKLDDKTENLIEQKTQTSILGCNQNVENTQTEQKSDKKSEEPKPTVKTTNKDGPKFRKKSTTENKCTSDSRRSSYSSLSDSRRSSFAFSPLNSFSNIQEKFQALSQEPQAEAILRKTPKVNKLNNEAFKIVKEGEVKLKEHVKGGPKVESDLQSKIMKFGASSGVTKVTKNSNVESKSKVGTETEINFEKATTVGVKNVVSVESEVKLVSENESVELKVGSEDSSTGLVSQGSETKEIKLKSTEKEKDKNMKKEEEDESNYVSVMTSKIKKTTSQSSIKSKSFVVKERTNVVKVEGNKDPTKGGTESTSLKKEGNNEEPATVNTTSNSSDKELKVSNAKNKTENELTKTEDKTLTMNSESEKKLERNQEEQKILIELPSLENKLEQQRQVVKKTGINEPLAANSEQSQSNVDNPNVKKTIESKTEKKEVEVKPKSGSVKAKKMTSSSSSIPKSKIENKSVAKSVETDKKIISVASSKTGKEFLRNESKTFLEKEKVSENKILEKNKLQSDLKPTENDQESRKLVKIDVQPALKVQNNEKNLQEIKEVEKQTSTSLKTKEDMKIMKDKNQTLSDESKIFENVENDERCLLGKDQLISKLETNGKTMKRNIETMKSVASTAQNNDENFSVNFQAKEKEKIIETESIPDSNPCKNQSKIPKSKVSLQNEAEVEKMSTLKKESILVKEALKVQESMTLLTNQANQLTKEKEDSEVQKLLAESTRFEEDVSETSCKSQENSISEPSSFRKDQKKILKKLKVRPKPDECYPPTQKLLTGKPVNAFEEARFEESKKDSVVSPAKVEAFLRETLSPPPLKGISKEPVKTIEAVVKEVVTSTSEKSKFEKPKPTQVKYSSRGEVLLGSVSIKPSAKVETFELPETLSAITLVPAFRPEKSLFDENKEKTEEDETRIGIKKEEKSVFEEPQRPIYGRERSFSPMSDFSDDSYDHYVASIDYSVDSSSFCDLYSRRRFQRSSSTPRRLFPQVALPCTNRGYKTKEDSPVVFDAGLSFDLSSNRSSLRHHFKPQPAFTDQKTNSNALSLRIADFLKRTDHIMEEWKHLGKGSGDDLQSLVELPSKKILGRSSSSCKSATNIMIKGLLNFSKGSRTPSMRSRSTVRTSEYSDRTISDIDELSEMTLDLSEERAASTAQVERLEAETAERVRLEQELSQIQHEKKNLQQTSERLEMELFYARADVNGLSESEADLEDGGGDAALYKNKCERAMRELEFTRRRLQQQHEDDLEQLVGLKKQLEKKLTDAYEEVEEQRQVAGQWKRKVQKLQSEMNDLRLLLEEQSSRNNLLEKKQRKFDSEIQLLQEELRAEKNQKERSSREKEMAIAEKYSMEQNLSSVRLELELKEEKVAALTRELEELTRGGGTEQEVTQLRKSKHDLEIKLKEQEEELDELAGQVSMLEGNKLRLEMSLESLRKEHRREMAQRDDELDEARANAQKKIKVLESQLESEHEERTLLVREKHELERRLADAEERGRHYRAADEDALQRARRDLKKTKALLRDAQVMLERAKQDSPSKAALRALKNQLEDAELARASAVKTKQSLESELNEVNGQLEEALRAKGDAENRCQVALRETNALRTQVDENEEELAELLKKYRQTVQQLSAEQLANQETAGALAEAEAERSSLRDQLAELTARLEANTIVDPVSGIAQKKLEIRIKELESRLELEQTTRGRLEVQISRLKENLERLNEECVQARTKEQTATDLTRKLQRSLREAKEELAAQQAKEQESVHKRKDLEKRLETAEKEASTARTDLRLAVKRIEDLQSAISGEIGSDSDRTESEEEESGDDSIMTHLPSPLSATSRATRTPELSPR